MPSCTLARVRSLTARMVPRISAESGITLPVVPATILATVTTVGSKTSMRRVTIICNAWTISHATGMGSSVRCGSLAWPPLPVMRMWSVSLEAMHGPGRVATYPMGLDDVMCIANAPVTGEGLPSSACGATFNRPSSSM